MGAKKTAIAFVTAVLALLSGVVLPVRAARATFPGRNGQIAYGLFSNSSGEEGPEVFPLGIEAIRPGRPSRRSLLFTRDPLVPSSCIESPSYSADGESIAFDARWGTEECEPYPPPAETLPFAKNLFVMSASGAEVRQVTKQAHVEDSEPAFSPEGEQLVFSRHVRKVTEIFSVNLDGSGLRQLTKGAKEEDLSPRYAPDGKHIVFDSRNGIEEMRPDGSGRRILIANRGKFRVSEPDFSPDGRLVAFVKSTSRTGSIYVARANGRSARQISPPAKVAGYGCGSFCAASPVFSPDGRLILFVTHGSEEAGLAEVRVKGGGKRAQTIVTRHFDLIRPSWQPLP